MAALSAGRDQLLLSEASTAGMKLSNRKTRKLPIGGGGASSKVAALDEMERHLNNVVKPVVKKGGWQKVSEADRDLVDHLWDLGNKDGDTAVRRQAWKVLRSFSEPSVKGSERKRDACDDLCERADKELEKCLSLDARSRKAAAKAICDIVSEWHAALEGAHRCGREAEDALSKAQQRLRRAMERRNTMHLRHVPASEGYFGERSEGSGPGQDNVWCHVPATMTGDGDWKSHSELLERLESQVEERKEIVRREETRVEAAAEARRKVEGERDEAAAVVDEVRVRLGHAMENGPQAAVLIAEGPAVSQSSATALLEEVEGAMWAICDRLEGTRRAEDAASEAVEMAVIDVAGAETMMLLARSEIDAARREADEEVTRAEEAVGEAREHADDAYDIEMRLHGALIGSSSSSSSRHRSESGAVVPCSPSSLSFLVLAREALAKCSRDGDGAVRQEALRAFVGSKSLPNGACVWRGDQDVMCLFCDTCVSDEMPSIRLLALGSLTLLLPPAHPLMLTAALACLEDPAPKVRSTALSILLEQTPRMATAPAVVIPSVLPPVESMRGSKVMLHVSGAGIQGVNGSYERCEGGAGAGEDYRLCDGRACTFRLSRGEGGWKVWHEVPRGGRRDGQEEGYKEEEGGGGDMCVYYKSEGGGGLEEGGVWGGGSWGLGKFGAHPLPKIAREERGWEEGDRLWTWREWENERGFVCDRGWVKGTVERCWVGRVQLHDSLLFDVRAHEDAVLLEAVQDGYILHDPSPAGDDDTSTSRRVVMRLLELVGRKGISDAVLGAASRALGELGRRGDAQLTRGLARCVREGRGGDGEARCRVVAALVKVSERGDGDAVEALVACMADDNVSIRLAAMKGLSAVAVKGDANVILRFLGALGVWCEAFPDSTGEKLFEASDPRLRCACIDVIVELSSHRKLESETMRRTKIELAMGLEEDGGLLENQESGVARVLYEGEGGEMPGQQQEQGVEGEVEDEQEMTEEELELENDIELAVIGRLDDCNDTVRATALNALPSVVSYNSARAVERLCLRIGHPDEAVRSIAISGLGLMCDAGNPAARRFITSSFLTHHDEGIRRTSLKAMSKVGLKGDREATAAVCKRMMDRSTAVRRLAAKVLRRLAGEGDTGVIDTLLSEEIVELPGGQIVNVLIGDDKDRSEVAYGRTPSGDQVFAYKVVEIGGGEAVIWDSWTHTEAEFRTLERDMRGFGVSDPDKEVRESSFACLDGITAKGDEEFTLSLCRLLASPFWDARRAASKILGVKAAKGEALALKVLLQRMEDRVGLVRRAALEAAQRVALRGDIDTVWAMSSVARSARDWETRGAAVEGVDGLMVSGHIGKVNGVATGPGGILATAGEDRALKVWDLTRREQTIFIDGSGHKGELQCTAISCKGLIACGEDDSNDGRGDGCRIMVYYGRVEGAALVAALKGHRMAVTCVDFDAGGRLLASCSLDETVRVWGTRTWDCQHVLKGHTEMLVCCAFAPSPPAWSSAGVDASPLLASGGFDKGVRVWDVSKTSMRMWGLERPPRHVEEEEEAGPDQGDAQYFAAFGAEPFEWGGVRDHARALDDRDSRPSLKVQFGGEGGKPKGHAAVVAGVAFAADGATCVSCSQDATIKLWSVEEKKLKKTLKQPTMSFSLADTVSSIAVSTNGSLVVSGSWDGTVKLFRVAAGRSPTVIKAHKGKVACVRLSADGRTVVSCGEDGTAKLWGADSGDNIGTLKGRLDEVSATLERLKTIIVEERERERSGKEVGGKWAGDAAFGECAAELCSIVEGIRAVRDAELEDERIARGEAGVKGRSIPAKDSAAAATGTKNGGAAGGKRVDGEPDSLDDATFEPDGGNFTSSAMVAIQCPVADADVYYTTDGSDPIIPSSFGGPCAQGPLDVGTSERAHHSGRNTHLITLVGSCYIKAVAVRAGDAPGRVARSLRFWIRCPPPLVIYDREKHPEQRRGGVGRILNECEVKLSCVVKAARVSYAICRRGEHPENMDATRFREWDSERGDAIQLGLGERLVCSSWMPKREAVGEVGKHRETLLGMEESAKVTFTHSLDGCAKCVTAGGSVKRTAVVLVTNQRDEVLVMQHSPAGRPLLLDPFLWAEIGEGVSAVDAAMQKVKSVFRKMDVPPLVPLSSRVFEGAGHMDLFKVSIKVPSTKGSQVALEQGLLHAAFVPVLTLLLMAKGTLAPEEMKETVKLFLADGGGELEMIQHTDPVDVFLKRAEGGGAGAGSKRAGGGGGGFRLGLEVLTEKRKEETGGINVRVNVTPSSTLAFLLSRVEAATETEGRPGGIPAERLLLMSAGTDLVAKNATAAGDGTGGRGNDDGMEASLDELGALESVEGAVYAQIKCPTFGRAEMVVLKEMAASGLLPSLTRTGGRAAAGNVQTAAAVAAAAAAAAEAEAGAHEDDKAEEDTAVAGLLVKEPEHIHNARRAWHKMLKRREAVARHSERITSEVKSLERRMAEISAALLSSHVIGDRLSSSDLRRTSADVRFLTRTLAESGPVPSNRGRVLRAVSRSAKIPKLSSKR